MMGSSALPPSPPPLAGGQLQPLDPRYVPFQRLIGWIFTLSMSAFALIGLLILWAVGELPRWAILALWLLWGATTAAVGWLSHTWPAAEFRRAGYRIDDAGIEIQWGIWWRRVTNVPRSRVQHIDVSQGPIERRFDLARLVIYTAGTDHSEVVLDGITHESALALRDRLLPRDADDAV